jgi:hypothetical protein
MKNQPNHNGKGGKNQGFFRDLELTFVKWTFLACPKSKIELRIQKKSGVFLKNPVSVDDMWNIRCCQSINNVGVFTLMVPRHHP